MTWTLQHSCVCGRVWTQKWTGIVDPHCTCGKSGGSWVKKAGQSHYVLHIKDRLVKS